MKKILGIIMVLAFVLGAYSEKALAETTPEFVYEGGGSYYEPEYEEWDDECWYDYTFEYSFDLSYYNTYSNGGSGTKSSPWNIGYSNPSDLTAWIENNTLHIAGTGKMMEFNCDSDVDDEIDGCLDSSFINLFLTDDIGLEGWFEGYYELALYYNIPWLHVENDGEDYAQVISDFDSVVFEDGCTVGSISSYAFIYQNISSITIPDSVASIGEYAFYETKLDCSLTLPANLKTIGDYAFYKQKVASQGSDLLPSKLETIGDYAFYQTLISGALNVPDKVTSIGANCFEGTSISGEIEFPESLVYLGKASFKNLGITKVTFDGKLPKTILDEEVRSDYRTYNELYRRDSFPSLPFYGCPIATKKLAASGTSYYMTYIGSKESDYAYAYALDTIPFEDRDKVVVDGIESETVGFCNFCTSMNGTSGCKEIILPSSIKRLGYDCFSGVNEKITGLKDLTIKYLPARMCYGGGVVSIDGFPKGLEAIGDECFYTCYGLYASGLVIPDGVRYIGSNSFGLFDSPSITIPQSVEYIGSSAFTSSNAKKSCTLNIPIGVNYVSPYAFGYVGVYGSTTYYDQKISTLNYTKNGKTVISVTTKLKSDSKASGSYYYVDAGKMASENSISSGRSYTIYNEDGSVKQTASNPTSDVLLIDTEKGVGIVSTDAAGNKVVDLMYSDDTIYASTDNKVQIEYDSDFLDSISAAASADLSFTATRVRTYDNVTYGKYKAVYDLTLTVSGNPVTDFNSDSLIVRLPYIGSLLNIDDYKVVYIDGDTVTDVDYVYENGCYVFETNHFSTFALTAENPVKSYTVCFDANGGSGIMDNITANIGQEFTLTANSFTKDGYTFAGWATSENGDVVYSDGTTVSTDLAGADETAVLYAKWTPQSYTLTYELNGGSLTASNPSTYNIETAIITLNEPVKDGYVFEGWYLESTFINKVTQIVLGSTGNKVLHAKWGLNLVYWTAGIDTSNSIDLSGAEFSWANVDGDDIWYDSSVYVTAGGVEYELVGYSYYSANYYDGYVNENYDYDTYLATKIYCGTKLIYQFIGTDYDNCPAFYFYPCGRNSGTYIGYNLPVIYSASLTVSNSPIPDADLETFVPFRVDEIPGWITYLSSPESTCKAAEIKSVSILNEICPMTLNSWFKNFNNVASIDISNINSSNTTDMSHMFDGCSSLTSIDFTGFDTSKVKDMSYLFKGCSSLASLDITMFNTASVLDMTSMFNGCAKLTSLNLNNFNTQKVTSMASMFSGCNYLMKNSGTFSTSSFNTSNVTDMSHMFDGCTYLNSQTFANYNTERVTDMSYMFKSCVNLISLDVSGFDTSSLLNAGGMFSDCSKLVTLDVSGWTNPRVTNMSLMFKNCSALVNLNITGFKTPSVINMSSMFYNCKKITSLNLYEFDTSNVTDMSSMFYNCIFTSLNVSSFNTEKVIDMSGMFEECWAIQNLDLSNFYTPNLTRVVSMFEGCTNLLNLNLTGFITSNVTSMYSMFEGCDKLASLDISSFDTSNVTSMDKMFYECKKLTVLDLSNFDTSSVTKGFSMMFRRCSSLEKLYLTNFSITPFNLCGEMFETCSSLKTIYVSDKWNQANIWSATNMFAGCASLVGGNNTPFTYTKTDQTYACIDKPGQVGYLTEYVEPDIYWSISVDGTTLNVSANAISGADTTTFVPFKASDAPGWIGYLGLDVLGNNTPTQAAYPALWAITTINFVDENGVEDRIAPTDLSNWFKNFVNVTTINNIGNLDTSKVIDMSSMFESCKSLGSLDLSGFVTNRVKDMSKMFNGCEMLTSLSIASFNTANVTDMSNMFAGCRRVTSLVLPSYFRTSLVSDMSNMFNGCQEITGLSLTGMNTSNVTDMSNMFAYCYKLTYADFSKFNTSNVTDMSSMFATCYGLKNLNISSFDTSNVVNMNNMFYSCINLKTLDIAGFDTSKVTDMSGMFNLDSTLTKIYVDRDKWNTDSVTNSTGMFGNCAALVGEKGTVCDGTNNISLTHAIVDKGSESDCPGYLSVHKYKLNGKYYDTLQYAIYAAYVCDNIVVYSDSSEATSDYVINKDITIDLNGHDLVVKSMAVTNSNAVIVDSAADDAKGSLSFVTDNGFSYTKSYAKTSQSDPVRQIPVQDGNKTYRFYDVAVGYVFKKSTSKYWRENDQAIVGAYLSDDCIENVLAEDGGVSMGVKINVGGTDSDWTFSVSLVQDYLDKHANSKPYFHIQGIDYDTTKSITINGFVRQMEDGIVYRYDGITKTVDLVNPQGS